MSSRSQFLVFGAPLIQEDEIAEVVATLRSGWLGTGPRVAQFEKDFQQYQGSNFALAVNSCTAGLHLSLLTLGLAPGDEVITTTMTFCATVNSIIHAGGTPVLVDVDPLTMNMDPLQVEARITERTRAILPVHFAGRPCNMNALMAIAQRHNLQVIEDCAHAIETEYHGRKAGTMGDFGCFSFYVTKNMTTGEGGMILARSEVDAHRMRMLALHGMSRDAWKRFSEQGYRHYQVMEAGFKYNMMDIQAALGIHQLRRVEANWLRRKAIWDYYTAELRNCPITCPAAPELGTVHAYHLYTILLNEPGTRDNFLMEMNKAQIGVGVHYLSIAEHPYYQATFGWQPEAYPEALRIGRQTVSLPLSAKLTDTDVEDVVHTVKQLLATRSKTLAS